MKNPTLGLRANLPQFSLLVLVNAFVGGMVVLERSIIPKLAETEFGLSSKSAILSFIVAFGILEHVITLTTNDIGGFVARLAQCLCSGNGIGRVFLPCGTDSNFIRSDIARMAF